MSEGKQALIKAETLRELGMDELLGTVFEEYMSVVSLGVGEEINAIEKQERALYIHSGGVQVAAYSREGRSFYRYLGPGEAFMVAESISPNRSDEFSKNYGMDLYIMEETTIVYLPLKEVFKCEIGDKLNILEKIMGMAAVEKADLISYCFGKVIYSDEEFLLKALEKRERFDVGTPVLARALNMNIRNLQRCLKKLDDMGIIQRDSTSIRIKDFEKFNEYKKRIEK